MHPHYIVPVLSAHWFAGIVGVLIVYSLFIQFGLYASRRGFEPHYRWALAAIFLIREFYLYAYIAQIGQFTIQDSLPLQLCGISYLCMTYFLIRPNYFLFEFLIMLGLAGAAHSLITPELTHGYSDYFIIDYYFSHGAIIFGPIYGLVVLKMRPRTRSWLRVFIFSNLLLFSIYLINLLLDSNYIYLMRAPIANNPFVLRPYPMHLVGFEIFGTLHILLVYWLCAKFKPKEIKV